MTAQLLNWQLLNNDRGYRNVSTGDTGYRVSDTYVNCKSSRRSPRYSTSWQRIQTTKRGYALIEMYVHYSD